MLGKKVGREDGGVLVQWIHPPVKIWTMREEVGNGIGDARDVVEGEVVIGEHFHPASLMTRDLMGFVKVHEIIVICEDVKRMSSA